MQLKYLLVGSILILMIGAAGTCQGQIVHDRGPVDQGLCSKLREIKQIPFEDDEVEDPVYNEFARAGKSLVPCLIDQLTNQTKMHDPRSVPTVANFRAGDLAFFILLKITKVPFEEMLPGAVRLAAKSDGVYAYFTYVRTAGHRKHLQDQWRAWLRKQNCNTQGLNC